MTPDPKQPNTEARDWLYAYEQCVRGRKFDAAKEMLHSRCIYFGLTVDDAVKDWKENWPSQLAFSFDLNRTKFIPEGNLTLASAIWMAKPLIKGSPDKVGRMTIGLMRFTGEKILAVIVHDSYQPA